MQEKGFNCSNFIVMTKKCFLGSLRINKSSSNCENFLNWSLIAPIKKYRKIPNNFQKIPVWKYKAYTVPKNTGIPGFCKNTVPYRTGIKFLIPLEPAHHMRTFLLRTSIMPILKSLSKKSFDNSVYFTMTILIPTTLITILTWELENLNSWQSFWPDN